MFVCRECRGFVEWIEMMVCEGLCVCVCVLSMYGVCAVCVSLCVCESCCKNVSFHQELKGKQTTGNHSAGGLIPHREEEGIRLSSVIVT